MELKQNAGWQVNGNVQEARWNAPEDKWTKLNTDGACKEGGVRTACGGLLRDHRGLRLKGFAAFKGSESVLSAPLEGILHGLQLTSSMNLKKTSIETDNAKALAFIDHGCPFHHEHFQLVLEITKMLYQDWQVNISRMAWRNIP